MQKKIEITGKEFRRMQLLELDMLVEFDRLCAKYNINYVLFGGSLLGAVRHKGFIPWDDDADIAMLREDYEKFKLHAREMNSNILYFQDHTNDAQYRWGYGKLRRTGTKFVRVGQEHLKCKTGVFVDVFPMDDIPLSTIGQMADDFYCFCLRKILYSEVGKISEKSKVKKVLYRFLSKINPEVVYRLLKRRADKSNSNSRNRVRCLMFPATGKLYRKNPLKLRYGMPKEWFTDRSIYDFEGKHLYGTKDYNTILKYIYGDYMKLPSDAEKEPHSPVSYYEF